MKNNPEGILFDLDGTLLDTAPDLGNALNHVLTKSNMPVCAYAEYRDRASDGAKGLLELGFGEKIKDFNFESLRQEFLSFYETNICLDTRAFAGIDELIQTLDSMAIPWGIVTNKPGWLTDSLLAYFDIFKRCAVVVSGDTLAQRKPDPAPLLYAAKKINVSPQTIWYVGDAERDIQAANAANMVGVVAEYGYVDKNGFAKWGAAFSVQSPYVLREKLTVSGKHNILR